MTTTATPLDTDLVRRTTELIPLLRKHAGWAEENRRLHEETIEAMAGAGLFRMRAPARYGGYESSGDTMLDVAAQLARGDGAAAWTASVWWIPTWMAGLFPDEVQDEVFATPDVRVCGTLSPAGSAVPAPGGFRVTGRWGFISGALHSHWQEIIAMAPAPDGGMWPVMALVPMSDLQIVDDWHTSGMRGSGSVTTVAEDVFVPAARVLPLVAVLQGQYASQANAASPMFRAPLLGVANASSVGTVIGLAQAAIEAFLERLPGRKITYTGYESQAEAPITHLQVADAVMKADEAEFHGRRVTAMLDQRGHTGQPWDVLERARSRGDVGAVCRLGKEAVDLLNEASGGSSIYSHVPIQRMARDMHAMTRHALMYPPTNMELFGRVLCGLEPNTLYI